MQSPQNSGQLPTLKEEIDRKSMEAALWLYESVTAGKITAAQFSTGLDALFMAVSGLANQDVFELITEGSEQAAQAEDRQRRVFIKGDSLVQITWKAGNTFIKLEMWAAGVARPERVMDFASPAIAFKQFNKLADATLANGFTEI